MVDKSYVVTYSDSIFYSCIMVDFGQLRDLVYLILKRMAWVTIYRFWVLFSHTAFSLPLKVNDARYRKPAAVVTTTYRCACILWHASHCQRVRVARLLLNLFGYLPSWTCSISQAQWNFISFRLSPQKGGGSFQQVVEPCESNTDMLHKDKHTSVLIDRLNKILCPFHNNENVYHFVL